MWALLVVIDEPRIEIGLQLVDPPVELLAERHAVELVEQRLVEALADAIGLRAARLGARVIDVLDRQVELVLVRLRLAAELGAAVGEHTAHRNLALRGCGSRELDECATSCRPGRQCAFLMQRRETWVSQSTIPQ